MNTEVKVAFDRVAQELYFKDVGLELAQRPKMRSGLFSVSEPKRVGSSSGDIIGDGVVVYEETLSAQQRQDAGDSLLFAEMRADAVCNKNRKDREKWYAEYDCALLNCGFRLKDLTFTDFKSKETKLTVNKAILQILQTIAGPNPAKIMNMMSIAFGTLKEDEEGLKLIERKSSENNGGTFKGVPCILDGGELTVLMACLDLKSKNTLVNGFWGEYNAEELKIYRAAGARVINQDAFGYVRDRVRGYIYGSQDDYFKNL
jgi:hypothetical protein